MVKKSGLISGLAHGLGISEGQVSLVYRALSEAHLITYTGGRGVNGPDLSELDCARILIALLATDRPRAAPQAVSDFGKLPMTGILRRGLDDKMVIEDGDPSVVVEDHIAAFIKKLSEMSPEAAEKVCLLAIIKCSPRIMQIEVWGDGGTRYFDDSAAFETEAAQERLQRYFQRLDVTRAVIGPTISDIAAIFRDKAHGA